MNGLFAALLFHELMEAELADSSSDSTGSSDNGDDMEAELQHITQRMPELGHFVASLRAAGRTGEAAQQRTRPRPPPPQQQSPSDEQGAAGARLPAGARGVLITVGDRVIFLPLE